MVALLFIASGFAALVYEVIWFQLIELVIGSTAVSLAVLLGTFMAGMCLGSLALPRLVRSSYHPLRVYALLEAGIAILALAILICLPYLDRFYAAYAGHGPLAVLLRGLVCAICLLPPTVLMGGTLPIVARWVKATPQGVSYLGFLYGANTAGAVLGCLVAGFYLLRVYDLTIATVVAAAVDAIVAILSWLLARSPARDLTEGQDHDGSLTQPERIVAIAPRSRPYVVYCAIALSGLSALGCEVIWTRLLSLLFGPTVYTFSVILGVFLFGLAIGSSIGAALARSARPATALGICQGILPVAMAWASYVITRSLPNWPIDPGLATNHWIGFQLDIVRSAWAILPATLLWGASFPLALAAVVGPGQDHGQEVGHVYAANTIGAICGAVLVNLVSIPDLGTQQTQRLLIVISLLSAMIVLLSSLHYLQLGTFRQSGPRPLRSWAAHVFLAILLVAIGLACAWTIGKVPWYLVAYGRYATTTKSGSNVAFLGEGMNASVAVTESPDGIRYFHVSGKVEASSEPQDMRLQRMLAHLSALLHPRPRSILVVGCGAGVTAGTFLVHPDVRRIVICEIEPLIPKVVAKYFEQENYGLIGDKRVEIVYDDARHYILTTRDKFDIITSDPIHPWVKGAATLYTVEYFQMCKAHLNPGGLITQWVPLYESTPEVVKSELATFFKVFPDGTIWSNDCSGQGYDTVVLAKDGPLQIDLESLMLRLDRDDHHAVVVSLNGVGFATLIDLLATYAGQAPDLRPWLADAQINRDRNLRLQYLAGLGLNAYQAATIYNQILSYRTFPNGLFRGSAATLEALRNAMSRR